MVTKQNSSQTSNTNVWQNCPRRFALRHSGSKILKITICNSISYDTCKKVETNQNSKDGEMSKLLDILEGLL